MMSQNQSKNNLPIDDDFAELLSAYYDGELSAEERTKVEERLATDPAAQRWLGELQTMGNLCQESKTSAEWQDLSSHVLSEAKRRQEDSKPQVAPRKEDSYGLEPAGEFGLPFGQSSRGWTWAAVAAAAAIIIGYWDRPDTQQPTTIAQNRPSVSQPAPGLAKEFQITPVNRWISQMRQEIPALRVVHVETNPQGRANFEQSLKNNGFNFQTASMSQSLPSELDSAQRAGIIEPYQPQTKDTSNNQLMFVSAEPPRYSNVVRDLSNDPKIFRVEADPAPTMLSAPAESAVQAVPTAGPSYVVRIQIRRTLSGKLQIQGKVQERKSLPSEKSQQLDPLLDSAIAQQRAQTARQNQGVGERQAAPATTAMAPRMGNVRVPVVFVLKTRQESGE